MPGPLGGLAPHSRRQVSAAFLGDDAANARLYYLVPGTLTALASYSDSGLSVPNAHPMVPDSAGLFGPVWLKPQAYKELLTTVARGTGNPIWVDEPISILAPYTVARAFVAKRTTNQAITTATPTKVQLNVESLDTDNQFDATTDFRFESTIEKSLWQFDVEVLIESMTGTFTVEVVASGGTLATASQVLSAAAGRLTLSCRNTTPFAGAQNVEVQVTHTHGSNRNVTAARFEGTFLGLVL